MVDTVSGMLPYPNPTNVPPLNLTGLTTNNFFTNILTDGLTFTNTLFTNVFQLPSVLTNVYGVNSSYTDTFTTNTFGTNTLVTDINPAGIFTTNYVLTTVAYSNYFSLDSLLVDGATYTYSVIVSNILFLTPYANSNGVLVSATNAVAGSIITNTGVAISPDGTTTNYFTNILTTTFYTYFVTNTSTYYYTSSYDLTTRATNVVASASISYTNDTGTLVFSNYQTSVDFEVPILANLPTQDKVGDLAGLASLPSPPWRWIR